MFCIIENAAFCDEAFVNNDFMFLSEAYLLLCIRKTYVLHLVRELL